MGRGRMNFLEIRLRPVIPERFLQTGDDVVSQSDRLQDGDGRTLRAYPKVELPGVGHVGGERVDACAGGDFLILGKRCFLQQEGEFIGKPRFECDGFPTAELRATTIDKGIERVALGSLDRLFKNRGGGHAVDGVEERLVVVESAGD